MALAFTTLVVRSARRVRLMFDAPLGGGAFTPSWFGVENIDGSGTNPNVVAALAIPGYPDHVELVLDADLTQGGLYELTIAAGVPPASGGTAPGYAQRFRPEGRPADPSPSVRVDDVIAELFQVDLIHDGKDFVEEASGDLAGVTGPENAKRAFQRRVISNGLAWRSGYGARARAFVDAPEPSLPELRGRVAEQAGRDDRIVRSAVEIPSVATDDGKPIVNVQLWFLGGFFDTVRA